MIYVLEILGGRYVKVGFTSSNDISNRISQLQTGCPFEIKVLALCDGTLRQEKSLHDSLSRSFFRIRIPHSPNEWYPGKNPFMRKFINEIRFGGFNAGFTYSNTYHSNVKQPSPKKLEMESNVKWPTK